MPKDRSSRVASSESRRSRGSPYFSSHGGSSVSCLTEESSAATVTANLSPHGRSRGSRRSEESSAAAAKLAAEWEEVRCPVCMDRPHNAVLLICSSHEKGCRPFMCDTSTRHSNCLDQYRKASQESTKDSGVTASTECSECQQPVNLSCPLCRGPVSHWIKDYDARRHMDCKVRSCTMESCEFMGVYSQLRKHAREEHPLVNPMEVDPVRQRNWRRMEQQRDIGDLLSMLRSGSGFSSSLDDAGLGAGEEGEQEITERTLHRHGPGHSITMIFIMRSTNSIQQYLSRRSRLVLVGRSVDALISHRGRYPVTEQSKNSPLEIPEEEDGGRGKGFMDGGDDRRRSGGSQGPGRPVPVELRAAVHPPDRQGQQRPRLLVAGQQGGAGRGDEARGGGDEDRHAPQLLGTQLGLVRSRCICLGFDAQPSFLVAMMMMMKSSAC